MASTLLIQTGIVWRGTNFGIDSVMNTESSGLGSYLSGVLFKLLEYKVAFDMSASK